MCIKTLRGLADAFRDMQFGTNYSFCVYLLPQAIETALDCLKSANTEPCYRRQAWEVIKCFLVAMMSLEDNKHALYQLLAHPKYVGNLILCYWMYLIGNEGWRGPSRVLNVMSMFLLVRKTTCYLSSNVSVGF